MGEKAEMWLGRWVRRRCSTGVLWVGLLVGELFVANSLDCESMKQEVEPGISQSRDQRTLKSNIIANASNLLEIPRTYPLLNPPSVQKLHQADETRLRHLLLHSAALDGLDFLVGFLLLLRRGQRVDVVEDVDAFADAAERGAHFAEHVVLGFACEGRGLGMGDGVLNCQVFRNVSWFFFLLFSSIFL